MRLRAAMWRLLKGHTTSGPRIDLFRDQIPGGPPSTFISSVSVKRLAIFELGLGNAPRAARRAAPQRVDLHDQLVARLQGLAGHAVTHESARAATFQVPNRRGAVLALDLQKDEGVRAGELEFLHAANEFDRVFLIEHSEGVMSQHGAARGHQSSDSDNC